MYYLLLREGNEILSSLMTCSRETGVKHRVQAAEKGKKFIYEEQTEQAGICLNIKSSYARGVGQDSE